MNASGTRTESGIGAEHREGARGAQTGEGTVRHMVRRQCAVVMCMCGSGSQKSRGCFRVDRKLVQRQS